MMAIIYMSYFNPRSSCEERQHDGTLKRAGTLFQSTLLMRGATRGSTRHSALGGNFNPRSSCEERPGIASIMRHTDDFNPRSSCEERLHDGGDSSSPRDYFNPRSSCEERRITSSPTERRRRFQSTLLMRGATGWRCKGLLAPQISIHAPHARSDTDCLSMEQRFRTISIHAPHARSDQRARRNGRD